MAEFFHCAEQKAFRSAVLSKSFAFTLLCVGILFSTPIVLLSTKSSGVWPPLIMRLAKLHKCTVIKDHLIVHLFTMDPSGKRFNRERLTAFSKLQSSIPSSVSIHINEKILFYPLSEVASVNPTELEVIIRMNVDSIEVLGISLLVPVHCILLPENHNPLNVVGLISERFVVDKKQTAINIFGTLRVNQKRALPAHFDQGEEYVTEIPLFPPSAPRRSGDINLEEILWAIAKKNFTLRLDQRIKIPSFDSTSATGLYHINLKISLPEQKLFYETPAVHQTKWVYIRYISIWIILVWPISKLLCYVFEGSVLQDNTASLIKPQICS